MLLFVACAFVTVSGIPDYRSPGRPPHKPMSHQMFIGSVEARKRYWARSMIGYSRMTSAKPNMGHKAIAKGEKDGKVMHVITQNVDDLHEQAGSTRVLHLHGNVHSVRCMSCQSLLHRGEMQERLQELNPTFADTMHEKMKFVPSIIPKFTHRSQSTPSTQSHTELKPYTISISTSQILSDPSVQADLQDAKRDPESAVRPDGDVELNYEHYSEFVVPDCPKCKNGMLKPDVGKIYLYVCSN